MINVSGVFGDGIKESCITVMNCENQCVAHCTNFLNATMFSDSLWLIYAGIFVIGLYYMFITNLEKGRIVDELRKRNYSVEKLRYNIHWILFAGILLICAFLAKFAIFTRTIGIPIT